MPTGSSLEAVCQAIEQNPARGWGRRAALTVRRFGAEAKTGDFVWTRDTDAHYRLCRITGGYRFDASPAAAKVDSYQVRRVEWARAAFGDLDVPGAVVRGFVGSADSFSRIHDHSARMLTPYLWEKLHGREPPRLHVTEREVFESHLDPYDVEDLIYVWLQVARGFVPRSSPQTTCCGWRGRNRTFCQRESARGSSWRRPETSTTASHVPAGLDPGAETGSAATFATDADALPGEISTFFTGADVVITGSDRPAASGRCDPQVACFPITKNGRFEGT